MDKNIQKIDTDIRSDMEFMEIHERIAPYTMTSIERQYALFNSVKYLINNNIKGDFVECGVWRGGSVMLMILTLQQLNCTRNIYMYDTFSGMSEPTTHDIRYNGVNAKDKWLTCQNETYNKWCYSSLAEVRENVFSTNYQNSKVFFIEGKVEETLPSKNPDSVSLLRLDTDWYESTKHELEHLYSKLSTGGVLILDDYGCWEGARKAVDEFFFEKNIPILLNRVDYTGRIAIKI